MWIQQSYRQKKECQVDMEKSWRLIYMQYWKSGCNIQRAVIYKEGFEIKKALWPKNDFRMLT